MNIITIKFPTSNKAKQLFEFTNNYRTLDYNDCDKVVVDFQSRDFARPAHLVVLACIIESIVEKNPFIKIGFENGGNKLKKHLENIKFKKYWQPNFNRDNFTSAFNSTTLCLWHISGTMLESYGQHAQKYYSRNFMTDKDLQPLSSNIVEVFNNIFDHSKSDINGYVLTQYYPKLNKLKFAICDFGIGIAQSIKDYVLAKEGKSLSSSEALNKSLERGFSVKSKPQNRGFGLNNVLEFSDSTEGTLTITSNDCTLVKKHSAEIEHHETSNFDGTLITVSVNSKKFEMYDEDEDVFYFENEF